MNRHTLWTKTLGSARLLLTAASVGLYCQSREGEGTFFFLLSWFFGRLVSNLFHCCLYSTLKDQDTRLEKKPKGWWHRKPINCATVSKPNDESDDGSYIQCYAKAACSALYVCTMAWQSTLWGQEQCLIKPTFCWFYFTHQFFSIFSSIRIWEKLFFTLPVYMFLVTL